MPKRLQPKKFKRIVHTLKNKIVLICSVAGFCVPLQICAQSVLIEAGNFTPLYGVKPDQKEVHVKAFRLDVHPVTTQKFHEFLKAHPKWYPKKISKILADSEYLSHWEKGMYPKEEAFSPVTNISWFAAHAYCQSQGGRLPTVLEWEYVAAASETKKDASRDPKFLKKLLSWYSKPYSGKLSNVGKEKPNFWGVYDMHGLIWEWTQDFNSVFVTGDNRQDKDKVKALFCGGGALGASSKENYAAFMRYALRNSVQGKYTLINLGFRCAYDRDVIPRESGESILFPLLDTSYFSLRIFFI